MSENNVEECFVKWLWWFFIFAQPFICRNLLIIQQFIANQFNNMIAYYQILYFHKQRKRNMFCKLSIFCFIWKRPRKVFRTYTKKCICCNKIFPLVTYVIKFLDVCKQEILFIYKTNDKWIVIYCQPSIEN